MPTGHANNAAAVTAGFKSTICDKGSAVPAAVRYECTLDKHLVGGAKRSGGYFRAFGVGSSQANAEAAANDALTNQRNHRYGSAAAGGSKDQDLSTLTVDVS